MPTDTLVDIVATLKLVNVRNSRADDAGRLAASLLNGPPTSVLWDVAELGPLQVIGATPQPSPSSPNSSSPNDTIVVPAGELQRRRLPRDFEDQVVEYLRAHPYSRVYEIAEHFNVKTKTVYYHMDNMEKRGKIIKTRNSSNPSITYSLPDGREPGKTSNSTDTTAAAPDAGDTSNSTDTTAAAPDAGDSRMGRILDGSVVWAARRMHAGPDKDERLKELILTILDRAPGSTTKFISDELHQPVFKVRGFLIDLENEKKIERRIKNDELFSKIGYYLRSGSV